MIFMRDTSTSTSAPAVSGVVALAEEYPYAAPYVARYGPTAPPGRRVPRRALGAPTATLGALTGHAPLRGLGATLRPLGCPSGASPQAPAVRPRTALVGARKGHLGRPGLALGAAPRGTRPANDLGLATRGVMPLPLLEGAL